MMVAVLLGALSLGACVDDNESASVTAVRDAQAARLNALAELYSAQAQSELIVGQAQADYLAAQAAYENARAAAEQASADKQQFELQQAQDEYQRNLEAINLEAQNRLIEAQMQAQRNEQEFLALANDLLKELYRTYAAEVSTLDNLKSQLNDQNYWLAQYQAQAISQEDYNAKQKAQYEMNIARYEAEIEAYNNYQGMDKAELSNQMTTLSLESSNAYQTYLQKQQVENTARAAFNEAHDEFNATADTAALKTLQAVQALYDLGFYSISVDNEVIDAENGLYVPYYTLNSEAAVVSERQYLNNVLENAENYLGAPKNGTTAATGLYVNLENAQAQLAAATTSKDQALIDQWTLEIANINDQIKSAEQNVLDAQENVDTFEAAIASFSGADLTAYDAAIEAFKKSDAVTAYIAAIEAREAAYETYSDINAEYSAVVNLYNNSVDVQTAIANRETWIAQQKQNIANLSNSSEQSVQQAEDEIARLETQIEMQQAVVDLAKENLDNAIAAQAGDEETPSEETPAA